MMAILANACLLTCLFMAQTNASKAIPWAMPGNFLDRLRISDLVVAGTVEYSAPSGAQTVHAELLDTNIARLRVDTIFRGKAERSLDFTWFSLHVDPLRGIAYAGPPIASFRAGKRYLVFLQHSGSGWVVSIPLYAIEMELAPSSGPPRDLSSLSTKRRNEAIAQELETAALSMPVPPPGVTGEADSYFGPVLDLIGGCAEPFYRRFLPSPSPDLASDALRWLNLVMSTHKTCKTALTQ